MVRIISQILYLPAFNQAVKTWSYLYLLENRYPKFILQGHE